MAPPDTIWHKESLKLKEIFGTREGFEICPNKFSHRPIKAPPCTWIPMIARVPVLSPNDHPNPSQGRQKDFGENQNFRKVSADPGQPENGMGKSSPARAHREAGGVTCSSDPRPLPLVRGSMYKKKLFRTWVNIDTAATIHKQFFTPPPKGCYL